MIFSFRWNVVINQLSRPSTLCSISAFIIAVILLIFLIMDTMQYWTEQVSSKIASVTRLFFSQKKTNPSYRKKQHKQRQQQSYAVIQWDCVYQPLLTATQVNTKPFWRFYVKFGFNLYSVVERNSPRSKEWLILYTTLVIHLLLFSWRVAIEVLMLKYQSLTSNTIIS